MKVQKQSQEDQLLNKINQKELFDLLTTKVHFDSKDYSEKDLNIDLVMKLKVPKETYTHKESQVAFSQIFHNTPSHFQQIYQVVQQFIHFLVQSQNEIQQNNKVMTRCMTTFKQLTKTQSKLHRVVFENYKLEQSQLMIDCSEQFVPEIDTFMLKYNMIMIILQSLCGFNVKCYLLVEQEEEIQQKYIYFLISQKIQNLMLLADRYSIKKQVEMSFIDFNVNDPVDKKGRPLKYHKFIKEGRPYKQSISLKQIKNDDSLNIKLDRTMMNENSMKDKQKRQQMIRQQQEQLQRLDKAKIFTYFQKCINRSLKLKTNNTITDILEQANLNQKQEWKYQNYCLRLQNQLVNIFANRDEQELSEQQKEYLFIHNRRKVNNGCYQYMKHIKKVKKFYQKIQQCNQQFGYSIHSYSNCFFPFRLSSKKKPFFQRLGHLLTYKYIQDTPIGTLSLFSRMQRIKLSFHCIEEYFKIQNFSKINLQIFAINDDFQKYGNLTYQFQHGQRDSIIKGGLNGKTLQNAWHSFIPFLSNIRTIRDYMGASFAFQTLVKIYLINFLTIIMPISVVATLVYQFYFTGTNHVTYKFSMVQLLFIIVSLSVYVEMWKHKQEEFMNSYGENNLYCGFRDTYNGPYFRNIISDKPNQFELDLNPQKRLMKLLGYIIIGAILTIQGFFFYGIRIAILKTYESFPYIGTNFLSIPHLLFYSIFYGVNFILYVLVIFKIITKIVGLQNYPTKKQHQQNIRYFSYIFSFGIELIGPLFLYVIEPFQNFSCYAAECTDQFSIYIYSRYLIIFFLVLRKFGYLIYYIYHSSNIKLNETMLDSQTQQKSRANALRYLDKSVKQMKFNNKLNYLLEFIQNQSKKTQIQHNLKEEALAIYYYCIYSVNFPFCAVLTFLGLYLQYIISRILILMTNRRPIPKSEELIELSQVFKIILHTCIIINSWALCFTYEFLQYDLSTLLQLFVTTITKDNILAFKIIVTFVLIIILEIIAYLVQNLIYNFMHNPLQKRMINKYNQYLFRVSEKQADRQLNKTTTFPIKTMFRTYTWDAVRDQKKSKFTFYKKYKEEFSHKKTIHNQTNQPIKIQKQDFHINLAFDQSQIKPKKLFINESDDQIR